MAVEAATRKLIVCVCVCCVLHAVVLLLCPSPLPRCVHRRRAAQAVEGSLLLPVDAGQAAASGEETPGNWKEEQTPQAIFFCVEMESRVEGKDVTEMDRVLDFQIFCWFSFFFIF